MGGNIIHETGVLVRAPIPLPAFRDAIEKTSDSGLQGLLSATRKHAVATQNREPREDEEDPLEPREHQSDDPQEEQ